jgi:undecaprenyl-diphosphatase
VIGFALEDPIANHMGEPWQIAILMAVFALVLWWADRRTMTCATHELSLKQGLGIGIAQSVALMPGVSRSGITISAARYLGLDRDASARLSFLLLVPTVLGAVVLKGVKDVLLGALPSGWVGPFVVGTIAAAGAGLLAIQWLLGYVRRHDYSLFVVYRLCLSAAILLLILTGVRAATF